MKTLHVAEDANYLTVQEAADALEIEAQSMRDHLSRGAFTTYKFKSLTLVSREEVTEWKKRQK